MNKNKLVVLLGILLLSLAGWTSSAPASVIVTSYNGNTSGTQSILSNNGKALGFMMPAGTDYTLNSVTVELTLTTSSTVTAYIYSNTHGVTTGNNTPNQLVGTFISLTPAANSTPTAYTFTLESPLTLSASSGYWLVLEDTSSFGWASSDADTGTSGYQPYFSSSIGATSIGGYFGTAGTNPSGWSASNGVTNDFTIDATALTVPEPETYALLFGAGLVLFFWQCRKIGRLA